MPIAQWRQLPHQLERIGEHRQELTPGHSYLTRELTYVPYAQRLPSQARAKLEAIRKKKQQAGSDKTQAQQFNRTPQPQHLHDGKSQASQTQQQSGARAKLNTIRERNGISPQPKKQQNRGHTR